MRPIPVLPRTRLQAALALIVSGWARCAPDALCCQMIAASAVRNDTMACPVHESMADRDVNRRPRSWSRAPE